MPFVKEREVGIGVGCNHCPLQKKNPVFGVGNLTADLMVVGMNPGDEEDKQGKPFVGLAGQTLNVILSQVGLSRDDVYVTNLVKCRTTAPNNPRKNRNPSREEISCCSPYLSVEIGNIGPRVIVALGNHAARWLTGSANIHKIRGEVFDTEYGRVLPTLHPAALNYSGGLQSRDFPLVVKDFVKAKRIAEGQSVEEQASTRSREYYAELRDVKAACRRVLDYDIISFDIETSRVDITDGLIIGIAFSGGNEAFYIPFVGWSDTEFQEVVSEVNRVLVSDVPKVAHSGKFDMKFLRRDGFTVNNFSDDTLLLSHLLDERKGVHSLESLLERYTDYPNHKRVLGEYIRENRIDVDAVGYSTIPLHILGPYAAGDVDGTLELYHVFSESIDSQRRSVQDNITLPLSSILVDAEARGVQADVQYLERLERETPSQLLQFEQTIYSKVGREFNIGSTVQLRGVLFEDLGYPVLKRTETGLASTDKGVLTTLARDGCEIAQDILDYRAVQKLYSTYIKGFIRRLDRNGRIHPDFLLHGTETGRLSCQNPNMQNIPRVRKDLPNMRNMIVAGEGYVLVEVDFSQVELRFIAQRSGDESMIQAFRDGEDLHRVTAAAVFHVSMDAVTEEQRDVAKTINFGIAYGRGPDSIARQLGCTKAQAKSYINDFFNARPRVKEWIDRTIAHTQQHGYSTSFFGRRRHFPSINSRNRAQRGHEERAACNFDIQSSASDLNNLAVIGVHRGISNLDAHLGFMVHDSAVWDVREAELDMFLSVYVKVAETPPEGLLVPLVIDAKVGMAWGSLEEVDLEKFRGC